MLNFFHNLGVGIASIFLLIFTGATGTSTAQMASTTPSSWNLTATATDTTENPSVSIPTQTEAQPVSVQSTIAPINQHISEPVTQPPVVVNVAQTPKVPTVAGCIVGGSYSATTGLSCSGDGQCGPGTVFDSAANECVTQLKYCQNRNGPDAAYDAANNNCTCAEGYTINANNQCTTPVSQSPTYSSACLDAQANSAALEQQINNLNEGYDALNPLSGANQRLEAQEAQLTTQETSLTDEMAIACGTALPPSQTYTPPVNTNCTVGDNGNISCQSSSY